MQNNKGDMIHNKIPKITLLQFLLKNLKLIINDLKKLVAIKTFRTKKTKIHELKFSRNIKKAFQYIESMCQRDHLAFVNYDNKVLVVMLNFAQNNQELALLHHIDTVPIFEKKQWKSQPFQLKKIKNILYGRGVNDNKGPLLFSYYIFRYIKDHHINLSINLKIIIGSAEETTWEGINYYKTINKAPDFAIAPDGNFPIVNQEMGIYQIIIHKSIHNNSHCRALSSLEQHIFTVNAITLTYKSQIVNFASHKAKSRNPMRIKNATAFDQMYRWFASNYHVPPFLKEIKQDFLEGHIMGQPGHALFAKEARQDSLALTSINLKNNFISLGIDIRYFFAKELKAYNKNLKAKDWEINIVKHLRPHHVSKDSELVTSFLNAYNKICQLHAKPITFAGASYARAFKNAVAFGTTFVNEKVNSHLPNENLNVVNMLKSSTIIFEGITNISKKRRL